MARQAIAEWKGDLKAGKGHVKFGSGAYEGDYSFTSRFEDKPGANPEEMIGAALGGCFSMALANTLAQLGFGANSSHTTADVHLGKDDKGFLITHIDLTCVGDVPNIGEALFLEHAEKTSKGCIIARALAATPISLKASLKR